MALRRSLQLFLGPALVFVAIGGACSSFTEADSATMPDAGDADIGAETDVDASPDAVADGGGPDGAAPTIVATSDLSPIVDVRLDDSRVLWTTSSGTPWDLTSASNLYAARSSGTMQTLGDGGVEQYFTGTARLGSLSGDGTAGSAWVSQIGAAGLMDSVAPGGLADSAFMVGPLTIRLVESNGILYWLSRDVTQGKTTVFSYTGNGGQSNTLKSLMDTTGSDLAIEETPDGPIVLVTFSAGIYGARVGGGGDLSMMLANSSITSITASRTGLYWTTLMGDVSYCQVDYAGSSPLTCASPTTVTPPGPDPVVNVRFDHGALFEATLGGSIYECTATTCPTTPLVRSAPLFDGIEYRYGHTMAASDSELFWSEGGANSAHRIMRVAR